MICNYILNNAPSKSIHETVFELWKDKKPSIFHSYVSGCPAEVRIYSLELRKLDPRI